MMSQAYGATHLADSVEWAHHQVAPKMINNFYEVEDLIFRSSASGRSIWRPNSSAIFIRFSGGLRFRRPYWVIWNTSSLYFCFFFIFFIVLLSNFGTKTAKKNSQSFFKIFELAMLGQGRRA
jgi:hypothetical protein